MERVGRSSRTPYKHWLLNAQLGQICGVLSRNHPDVPARACPHLMVDLCAGDGEVTPDHQSSPHIMVKHAKWCATHGIPVAIQFWEVAEHSFNRLCENVDQYRLEFDIDIRLINDDARKWRHVPTHPHQSIFINCDPNSINELPIPQDFDRQLTPTTTMTVTLGCNVGGLKRLSLERRQEWYEYIRLLLEPMPQWHDALLVELVRDEAQWAYFTRLPAKWSQSHAMAIPKRSKSLCGKEAVVASYRDSRSDFLSMVDRLFLTKKERNAC